MDNITHSLVGVLVADSFLPKGNSSQRKWFRIVGILSSNLPDLDFLYSWITGGKLGYLLHHRGHTHTVGLIIPLALVSLFFLWLWRGCQKLPHRGLLLGAAIAGLSLHIAMDSLNSYGTHPLWPFSNRWIFGDTLFIIEPTLWIALFPLCFDGASKKIRTFLTSAYVILAIPILWTNLISPLIKLFLVVTGATWPLLASRLSPVRRNSSCGILLVLIVLIFAVAGAQVDQIIRNELVVSQIVRSPLPSNPFCWQVWVQGTKELQFFRASVAVLPSLIPPSDCPFRVSDQSTALYKKPHLPSSRHIEWSGDYQKSVDEFKTVAENCEMKALLQFARVPFWEKQGEGLIMGDLRFDWDERLSFAEFFATQHCPTNLPTWDKPFRINMPTAKAHGLHRKKEEF